MVPAPTGTKSFWGGETQTAFSSFCSSLDLHNRSRLRTLPSLRCLSPSSACWKLFFFTHQLIWDDCRELQGILFTIKERDMIMTVVRKTEMGP